MHLGTAESGHYYSYIRQGQNWFEFNDALVVPFDPSELKKETFGGYENLSSKSKSAYLLFYERVQRPAEFHWPPWLDGQAEKARQGLDALETEVASFPEPVDLAQIAAAITLGWLEFRAPLGDLRATHPRLFAWYDRFRERPSMKATEPHT